MVVLVDFCQIYKYFRREIEDIEGCSVVTWTEGVLQVYMYKISATDFEKSVKKSTINAINKNGVYCFTR